MEIENLIKQTRRAAVVLAVAAKAVGARQTFVRDRK